MKNMLSSTVEISKACALLTRSSAPFMERHLLTSITPRGWESCTREPVMIAVSVMSRRQQDPPLLRVLTSDAMCHTSAFSLFKRCPRPAALEQRLRSFVQHHVHTVNALFLAGFNPAGRQPQRTVKVGMRAPA